MKNNKDFTFWLLKLNKIYRENVMVTIAGTPCSEWCLYRVITPDWIKYYIVWEDGSFTHVLKGFDMR